MCNVFEAHILGAKNGTVCNGEQKKHFETKNAMVSTNYPVAQIIADAI